MKRVKKSIWNQGIQRLPPPSSPYGCIRKVQAVYFFIAPLHAFAQAFNPHKKDRGVQQSTLCEKFPLGCTKITLDAIEPMRPGNEFMTRLLKLLIGSHPTGNRNLHQI